MITDHVGFEAAATFSDDRVYRYLLTRTWGWPGDRRAVFIMLNPSTADAYRLDPTLRRCRSFAVREGCGGMAVVNLFALRSTSPKVLQGHPDPVGPDNDMVITRTCRDVLIANSLVICAWGTMGGLNGRATAVTSMLRDAGVQLHHLGLSAYGHPRHPLYIPGRAGLHVWDLPLDAGGENLGTGEGDPPRQREGWRR